jgi:hypothetical protein
MVHNTRFRLFQSFMAHSFIAGHYTRSSHSLITHSTKLVPAISHSPHSLNTSHSLQHSHYSALGLLGYSRFDRWVHGARQHCILLGHGRSAITLILSGNFRLFDFSYSRFQLPSPTTLLSTLP